MKHIPAHTLFDKLWAAHQVSDSDGATSGQGDLLYIDRIFLHERTGSVALQSLAESGRQVKDSSRVFCTMDHIVDTHVGRGDSTLVPSGQLFIETTRAASHAADIRLFDINDPLQGISHVLAAELGIVLPGTSTVCPDSHTCSLGALGALAIGIGSSQTEHALATNTLRLQKPKNMLIECDGQFARQVCAKDLALYLIARFGSRGGLGCAVEYSGSAITQLSLEGRLTLCNLAVEFAAFTAVIAPDQKVFDALENTLYAPSGSMWQAAMADWQCLQSDPQADFDFRYQVDVSALKPMVSWGTNPEQSIAIDECVPDPQQYESSAADTQRALDYQGLQPGQRLTDTSVDAAFIGSCTNARLSDLRSAAAIVAGHKVAAGVAAVVVPGSQSVKRAAENEGLDEIFIDAGFDWREPGCSMCFYAGGETFGPQKRVISTTNRNFEGRQGPSTRTHLASPAVVAASAINGTITAPS